jgi:hypothetical protein
MMIIEILKQQLRQSAHHNGSVQAAPAAILWTDGERQWQSAMPFIKQQLPEVIELGEYEPEERIGPAIWLKCVVAGLLEECQLPGGLTPIIYLPGVSRKDLRAIESCPEFIKPLAELQYRGCWWTYPNLNRDWTVGAFLTNSHIGLELDIAKDKQTQESLLTVLPDLLETPVSQLQGKKLEASDFISIVLNDPVKDILGWLNQPEEKAVSWKGSKWDVFVQSCRAHYGFDPLREDISDICQLLCLAEGAWQDVWQRFEETATNLLNIIERLKAIQPDGLAMVHPEHYLTENMRDEEQIESVILQVDGQSNDTIKQALIRVWQQQQSRKEWLWFSLGLSPWLEILEELVALVEHTQVAFTGADPQGMADMYAERFWKADGAVIKAMSKARHIQHEEALATLLGVIYTPWLEETTLNFQKLVEQQGYPGENQVRSGVGQYHLGGQVVFFVDGLRLDTAHWLQDKLTKHENRQVVLSTKWSALPSLTATAKAAVTPVADLLTGMLDNDDFKPAVASTMAEFSSHQLKRMLGNVGWQYLDGLETGDVSGYAWVQTGDLDHLGHDHQRKMPQHIDSVLNDVVARIEGLLEAGWRQIKIVTDHGWLWVPNGLPKGNLHKALGKNRQRRCAILKDNVTHDGLVMPWYWNPSVNIAMAPGISAYVTGDYYNHGGLSLQECLTPVLDVKKGE